MSKPKTRAEQNAETRRRLLTAARRLFLRKGFHATSLADVASKAGYTKGAVFSQFENKADLFLALMEERSAERIARIEAMSFDGADAHALAEALAEDWHENQSAQRDWSLLVVEFRVYAARDAAVGRRYAAIHAKLRRALVEQYRRHLAASGMEVVLDLDEVARAALAISHGVLLEQLAEDDFDAKRVVQTLARGLLRDERS